MGKAELKRRVDAAALLLSPSPADLEGFDIVVRDGGTGEVLEECSLTWTRSAGKRVGAR